MSANDTCLSPAASVPFSARRESGFAPANGAESATAYCRKRLIASHGAPAITDIAIAVAHEPPETGPAGNDELPSSTSIFSSGNPVN
ncbi:UNVERIFIED_ORG: hypothetical protein J2Y81_003421 [Paraburkholderia sediminicola]|nr:hypothetical protein [Paraburkholderia sediminicola]